jgi:hypothetical protein
MAVSSAGAWSNTTDIIASAVAARLKAVKIRLNPDSTAASYIQIFDSADATPGTTAPNDVIYCPAASTAGRDAEMNVNYGGKWYNTGITWFVSTTYNGATAATTSAPLLVDVHYTIGA